MIFYSSLLLAAVSLLQLATSDPSPNETSTQAPQASTLAVRRLYNAGSDKAYELANEQIAWDDANSLAVAANEWSVGGRWQPILDYYFGTKGCQEDFAQTEIKSALTNAVNVHTVGIPIFRSRLFIYLHETGNYDPPLFGQAHCDDSTYAYSLNFKGVIWNDYYVVFCDLFWNRTAQPGRIGSAEPLRILTSLKAEVLAKKNGGNDQTGNATLLYYTTGHVYLHELHHFEPLVSPRLYGTNDIAYTARGVHNLADYAGCAPGDDLQTLSSLNNADSYATFSDAAYWSEQFGKASQDFPKWNIADSATVDTVSTFSAAPPAFTPANGAIPSGLPADPNKPDDPAPADATVTMSESNSSATTPASSTSAAPTSSPSCAPGSAPLADVQASIQALTGQLCGGVEASCSQAAASGMAAIELCGGSTDICVSASLVAGYATSIVNACNSDGQIGGSQAVNEAPGLNVNITLGNDT